VPPRFTKKTERKPTKPEFVERVHSGFLKYETVTADDPLIRLHGHAAVTIHRDRPSRHPVSGARTAKIRGLYYTAVYGWTARHWRMLAWQSTARADARVHGRGYRSWSSVHRKR